MDNRNITVTLRARQRIDNCDNIATLQSWAVRVGAIATIDELFDNSPSPE